MPRIEVVLLPAADLDMLFDALQVLQKIDRDQLTTEIATRDPSNAIPVGQSFIFKHRRADGTHVATTHVLLDSQSIVRHRHGKDILLGTLKLAARSERR